MGVFNYLITKNTMIPKLIHLKIRSYIGRQLLDFSAAKASYPQKCRLSIPAMKQQPIKTILCTHLMEPLSDPAIFP